MLKLFSSVVYNACLSDMEICVMKTKYLRSNPLEWQQLKKSLDPSQGDGNLFKMLINITFFIKIAIP